ncbi:hypothetical protein CVT26_001044, partial [Gymnopilus dilepis]
MQMQAVTLRDPADPAPADRHSCYCSYLNLGPAHAHSRPRPSQGTLKVSNPSDSDSDSPSYASLGIGRTSSRRASSPSPSPSLSSSPSSPSSPSPSPSEFPFPPSTRSFSYSLSASQSTAYLNRLLTPPSSDETHPVRHEQEQGQGRGHWQGVQDVQGVDVVDVAEKIRKRRQAFVHAVRVAAAAAVQDGEGGEGRDGRDGYTEFPFSYSQSYRAMSRRSSMSRSLSRTRQFLQADMDVDVDADADEHGLDGLKRSSSTLPPSYESDHSYDNILHTGTSGYNYAYAYERNDLHERDQEEQGEDTIVIAPLQFQTPPPPPSLSRLASCTTLQIPAPAVLPDVEVHEHHLQRLPTIQQPVQLGQLGALDVQPQQLEAFEVEHLKYGDEQGLRLRHAPPTPPPSRLRPWVVEKDSGLSYIGSPNPNLKDMPPPAPTLPLKTPSAQRRRPHKEEEERVWPWPTNGNGDLHSPQPKRLEAARMREGREVPLRFADIRPLSIQRKQQQQEQQVQEQGYLPGYHDAGMGTGLERRERGHWRAADHYHPQLHSQEAPQQYLHPPREPHHAQMPSPPPLALIPAHAHRRGTTHRRRDPESGVLCFDERDR